MTAAISPVSSVFAVALEVLAQGAIHAGLVALALALKPVENVGVDAQRERALDGAVERAAHRMAPISDGRHICGVDLALRHRGQNIQLGLQLWGQRLWVTSLHISQDSSSPFRGPKSSASGPPYIQYRIYIYRFCQ